MNGETLSGLGGELKASHSMFGKMLDDLIRDAGGPGFFWQLLVLAGCLAVAWPLGRYVVRRLEARYASSSFSLRFAAASLERAMFPLAGWVLVMIARFALEPLIPISVLRLALVPLFGITALNVAFYILRRVMSGSGQLHGMLLLVEKVLTTLVWVGMALYVVGVLSDVVGWMQDVRFSIGGKQKISLADTLMAVVWILLTVLVAMWFGSWLEERLMRSANLDVNLKVVLTRISKALLLLVSLLLSLSLVGIDLTVLSVFGGALGVGLGLGLQKIASNYISGFIILLDRSVKLGDQITVDKYTGIVSQIRTRYTVVRNGDGETLVPNEQLVAQSVQNHSFSNTNVRVATRVQADYSADPETVIALLTDCVRDLPRVLQEPEPAAFLVLFADSGIEYEVAVYVADPQNGKLGVQSAMNRAIWRTLREHDISIPYPQRELRVMHEAPMPGPGAPKASALPEAANAT
ncbi:mechanosensitive ion channel protein [Cupriavidus sp. TA19]|uniref:mechanosensitive ion channel family protein n=1 Tax=unclassified Cupriavidus TaxID=2640874 RepID=UPI000E2F3632|nr:MULTISPECIES: mechanosensitive ion channel domain-containing protein [unclassified Cupriavidus]BDB25323.1 mechanosensitive ion channel family protein [Cupriavidus sp. P-10]GLC95375.1 mechanosensitive ion channel protein [Cupriavidus sp. TA19]